MRFLELYLPVLAILFGVAILTGVISGHVERLWRRRQCRREMARMPKDVGCIAPYRVVRIPKPVYYLSSDGIVCVAPGDESSERRRLEGAASAQDKFARKIH